MGRKIGLPCEIVRECGRRVVQVAQRRASPSRSQRVAEFGIANANSVFQHRVEDRLQIARRTRDDLQHLRGCRLLLQRLAQIIGTLTKFVEEARVLDGDDGLGGEVF